MLGRVRRHPTDSRDVLQHPCGTWDSAVQGQKPPGMVERHRALSGGFLQSAGLSKCISVIQMFQCLRLKTVEIMSLKALFKRIYLS